mgnify:FL=1
MRAKGIFIIVMLLMGFAWVKPAAALEAYSPAQTQQFTDWCTGAKAATEGVCSCTLKNLSKTDAPAALAAFIPSQSGGGGFSLSTSAVTTTALVTNALVGCSK